MDGMQLLLEPHCLGLRLLERMIQRLKALLLT